MRGGGDKGTGTGQGGVAESSIASVDEFLLAGGQLGVMFFLEDSA